MNADVRSVPMHELGHALSAWGPDTDGDDLPDGVEYNITLTAPDEVRTYENGVTEDHQDLIDALDNHDDGPRDGTYIARTVGIIDDGETLSEVRLTDRTDDFDFVVDDSLDAGSDIRRVEDRLDFRMIDGNQRKEVQRTDTWFSNQMEIAYRQSDTDSEAQEKLRSVDEDGLPVESRTVSHYYVWDPDTDDDGLTDGQEERGLTEVRSFTEWAIRENTGTQYETDPWDPDTDDDEYWDGWIGVYDVGYSDNVILYEEHLHNGDGIEGDEIVEEQTGIHDVDAVPSAVGADINDDTVKEHSNVHIGERQWGTNPTDGTDSPTVGVKVEADFVEGLPDRTLNHPKWEEGIEENYKLYGISLDIVRDDTIAKADSGGLNPLDDVASTRELVSKSNDENLDLYLLVTYSPGRYVPQSESTGVNIEAILRDAGELHPNPWAEELGTIIGRNSHLVFAENIADSNLNADPDDYKQTPYTSDMQLISAAVELHEIGHSFHIGEADDTSAPLPAGEVYSGLPNDDDTPERYQPNTNPQWSIMRSGWSDNSIFTEQKATYHVFSIEELLTIEQR